MITPILDWLKWTGRWLKSVSRWSEMPGDRFEFEKNWELLCVLKIGHPFWLIMYIISKIKSFVRFTTTAPSPLRKSRSHDVDRLLIRELNLKPYCSVKKGKAKTLSRHLLSNLWRSGLLTCGALGFYAPNSGRWLWAGALSRYVSSFCSHMSIT